MINNFAILFSTAMVMYIVWRAAKLDRVLPWFETRSLYEQTLQRQRLADGAAKRTGIFGRQSPPPSGASKQGPANRR
jgi:hypothetical protein